MEIGDVRGILLIIGAILLLIAIFEDNIDSQFIRIKNKLTKWQRGLMFVLGSLAIGLGLALSGVFSQSNNTTPTPTDSIDNIEPGTIPTETQQPTLTNPPTALATETATLTHTPTHTLLPESTAPPTSVPLTPIHVPTDTSVPPSGDPITLTIYRDEDSFTLYVPQVDSEMSLIGLEYRVQRTDGSTILRQLDRDYAAFLGMPFLNIYSLRRSICFRLVRDESNVPAPQDCQNALLLTQNVADADVFWYDSSANVAYSVQIMRDGNLVSLCPAGRAQCDIEWWIG